MGTPDVSLEDKMITIVYGTDMVNLSYLNFAATSREMASVSAHSPPNMAFSVKVLEQILWNLIDSQYR